MHTSLRHCSLIKCTQSVGHKHFCVCSLIVSNRLPITCVQSSRSSLMSASVSPRHERRRKWRKTHKPIRQTNNQSINQSFMPKFSVYKNIFCKYSGSQTITLEDTVYVKKHVVTKHDDFPITFSICSYNSLYYRTSCDNVYRIGLALTQNIANKHIYSMYVNLVQIYKP